jgi:hypothetical protein
VNPSRNYWPHGIILAVALFVAGTAGLIVLAAAHRSDLVSPDYYDQEIRYQARLDSRGRAQALGPAAAVDYDDARRELAITLPSDHVRRGATGRVQLYRPSAAGLDRQFKLEPDPSGRQIISVADVRAGLWQVQVSWSVEGQDYFLDRKIVLSEVTATRH